MPYSLLDLSPVPEGFEAADAIQNTLDLAKKAESWGYHRFWLAEHHNMPGIASAATAVLIALVAQATSRMRVGAGGIMLPNHAPLTVAEAFGTLATVFPDRIDLGLGRAPGGDAAVIRALRRDPMADSFPQDVVELLTYFGPENPAAPVRALPGEGTNVPIWILGSSLYGAQLAAHLGLPYAFASHFAPGDMDQALQIYRDRFRPSDWLDQPKAMIAINVFAADDADEAHYLRSSMQLGFARLRTGMPGKLPAPTRDLDGAIGAQMRRMVDQALRVTTVGNPAQVEEQLRALIAAYQPDEVILTGQIHDHAARLRSFEIASQVMAGL
ncbi:LLM class flavin-dependent oxidoreductase [Paracoccus fistulariae]|uniref:LLM class flavin-dependent oxidoreductase n=1 Tax=Paracoccus fistulariae TaxID=658446 RepID=A0ABY7SPZ1_9RHOB|nr:LLM class flavin-dependent oxidoreductase [Paracoccus fistulariae]MDB6180668.1 LLM class flavin-dependent oxidoreductase [Paracoccus fistulariae]WCR09120.1 LLM class flavin-dependent oxidoreductase [Paracoccus fistulariae]